jgi:cobalt-zinc-cadmium efflux system outer membrane protein
MRDSLGQPCRWIIAASLLLGSNQVAFAQSTAVAVAETPRVPDSLPGFVELARAHAPEVLVANARLKTSRAAMAGARLAPLGNPYLEVVTARGNQGVTRDVELSTAVTLPVEFAGQRSRRIDEANAYIAAHDADLERVRATAAGSAVYAWGLATCESLRLTALGDLAKSAQAEFEMLAARRIAGDATEQDVQMAAVELGHQRMLLDEARANLANALGLMERLTGIEWRNAPTAPLQPPIDDLLARTNVGVAQAPGVRARRLEAEFHARTFARYGRESWSPLNLTVLGGRGDFGETRFGFGVGMNLPIIRSFQGEKERALAERDRAATEARTQELEIGVRVRAIARELQWLHHAVQELEQSTGPAAEAAVRAATELRRLGKSDFLAVVVARRELSLLTQRKVELSQREWSLLAEWVALIGKLP